MSARHPSWDTTPARRAMWDHTAAQGTPTLLGALDIVDAIPREATTAEHRLTRLVMIDVLEARHSVNPIVDEDLAHLWDDDDDEQSYVDVLRAAIAYREQVTR